METLQSCCKSVKQPEKAKQDETPIAELKPFVVMLIGLDSTFIIATLYYTMVCNGGALL